jgi:ribulose-phosphate 3-epimerase
MITNQGLNVDIEVDGGINNSNVRDVIDAGANIIVAGTAVFNGNIENNILNFKNIFNS